MSFLLAGSGGTPLTDVAPNVERQRLMTSAPNSLHAIALNLLVSVCGLLNFEHYSMLSRALWSAYADEKEKATFGSVSGCQRS